eukprot:scaffold24029_cov144-Skeletonema_dohrnii-CCMP3373.AAC.5
MICPNAAFCNVENKDVEGNILNTMEYHALAAGPKTNSPTRKLVNMRDQTKGALSSSSPPRSIN